MSFGFACYSCFVFICVVFGELCCLCWCLGLVFALVVV